jgi:DnaJ-class molecular chaperone
MPVVLQEEETKVLVPCAFCGGRGKDPFGIMSRLSTCYVCGGEQGLWVNKPIKACLFCRGTGVSPTGARNACAACRGVGAVHLREPSQTCTTCGGTGWCQPVRLYCHVCMGKGAIPLKTEV